MALSKHNVFGRCGARLHPPGDASFAGDVAIVVGKAAARLAYVMLPKVESVADVQRAARGDRRGRAAAARFRCTP